ITVRGHRGIAHRSRGARQLSAAARAALGGVQWESLSQTGDVNLPLLRAGSRSAQVILAMSVSLLDLTLNYLPTLPRRRDIRIGCAGAGFIMRDCHLVAYRQAGFNPVAIASRDPARAREAAQRHDIARVHTSYAELLADSDIEVLDIAVPPDAQPA